MAESIGPLRAMLTSNQDLQNEINALETQMQGLQPGTPEYIYDELNLEREQEEQKIRDANPALNPLNPDDNKKLEQLLAQDPVYQEICDELDEDRKEYASEISSWGIPWYPTGSMAVQ